MIGAPVEALVALFELVAAVAVLMRLFDDAVGMEAPFSSEFGELDSASRFVDIPNDELASASLALLR